MSQPRLGPVERVAAAAFYAPIGLGAQLVDDLPGTIGKAKQQIVLARFIGKMAVDQGVKQLRERVGGDDTVVPPQPPQQPASDAGDDSGDVVAEQGSGPAPTITAEMLALPDYDQLPAAHIVAKLAGLTQAERDEIEAYEVSGRHRRTVLGKLDQLRIDE